MPDSIVYIEEMTQPNKRIKVSYTADQLKASLGQAPKEEKPPAREIQRSDSIEDILLGGGR